MKYIKRCWLVVSVYCLVVSMPAYGLLNLSGEGEGYSRNYSTLSKGYDAVEWNPANLSIGPKFSFNLLTIGMEYNSTLKWSDFLNLCFSGQHYNDEDKKIFDKGLSTDFLAGAQAVSLSWSNYALTTYLFTKNSINIPEEVSQLIFYGNVIEKDTAYSLNGIEGEGEMDLVVGLSGAKYLGATEEEKAYRMLGENCGVGATVKYFQGFYYMGIDSSAGEIVTTMDAIRGNGEITYKYAEGGNGWGLDLGFLYFTDLFTISASVINFVSAVVWNKETQVVKINFELDSTNIIDFDQDTSFTSTSETIKGKSFTTHEQTISHIGAAIRLGKVSTLVLDGGYPQLFGIGVEQKLTEFLDFRTGLSYRDSHMWFGGGIGLKARALNLDLGVCISSLSRFSTALSISIVK